MSSRTDHAAIGTIFAVHGAVAGTFATRVPAIAERLDLSPGELGVALFMPAVSSLILMPMTGRLIHRIGTRTATRLLIAVWCLAPILTAVAPNLPGLCATLLVFGAAAGTADVAMNAQGVATEAHIGRSIMSSLHGLWSIGGFAAAGAGALVVKADLGVLPHFAAMAALLLLISQVAGPRLAATAADEVDDGEPAPPRFALPRGPVLAVALLAFCAVFPEIAGLDWAAVYLTRVLDSGHATAALGYTVFAAGMAICRLLGDRIIRRFGAVPTVRTGAVAGTIGAALVVWAVNAPVTIVGFGLLGVGISVVVPLAFATAGRVGSQSGRAQTGNAIAGVATIAYGAGLAAPGIIGGVASLSSLRISFVLVAVLVATVALTAGVLSSATEGGDEPTEPAGRVEVPAAD
ncbi:MFS transporter [Dactylosporangium sp. NPDC005555]|uniref:MFS transporter n=1 Tax=Dactylosporangium sp. NPDC005555 TaxID=3154889 RepID=UPI0033A3B15D